MKIQFHLKRVLGATYTFSVLHDDAHRKRYVNVHVDGISEPVVQLQIPFKRFDVKLGFDNDYVLVTIKKIIERKVNKTDGTSSIHV